MVWVGKQRVKMETDKTNGTEKADVKIPLQIIEKAERYLTNMPLIC